MRAPSHAITLAWEGRDYTIPANRVMGGSLASRTREELALYLNRGAMPLAKFAMAYGAVLRFAGAQVEDEQSILACSAGAAKARNKPCSVR
jgi:hypothetical protein